MRIQYNTPASSRTGLIETDPSQLLNKGELGLDLRSALSTQRSRVFWIYILRAALGLAVLVQSGFYSSAADATSTQWAMAVAAILAGNLLLVGFLTQLAGAAVGLGALGISLSLLPPATATRFESPVAVAFGATILLGTVILGPGGFSVDARVFGRLR
jgi:hypothetical protein